MDWKNALFGNWQTTVAGIILAIVNQITQNGTTFPSTRQEWGTTLTSIGMVAMGVVAKSANVGSKG